ncbi:MAG TPA: distal tail protein Dit, partial [Massilibacterium sp.]|nr:distal tail protein Dit [Massilibacterium sp.]
MKYFIFDNQTRSYLKIERGSKRPAWAPIRRDMINIPGRVGALLISSEVEPISIDIPVRIKGENIADLQKLKEDLADWLVHDNVKELVFDDEPDRTYYAVVDGTLDLDEIVYYGKGVITFICPDGVKYGPKKEIKINPM